jgi:hypothetical protein
MKLSDLVVVASLDHQRSLLRGQMAALLEGKLDISISCHSLDKDVIHAATPCVATALAARIRVIDDRLEDLNVYVDD